MLLPIYKYYWEIIADKLYACVKHLVFFDSCKEWKSTTSIHNQYSLSFLLLITIKRNLQTLHWNAQKILVSICVVICNYSIDYVFISIKIASRKILALISYFHVFLDNTIDILHITTMFHVIQGWTTPDKTQKVIFV